jgi:hypothetical protein
MTAFLSLPDIYWKPAPVSFWHTNELHVAKLLAVKRTVVSVSKWPLAASDIITKGMDYFFKIWHPS